MDCEFRRVKLKYIDYALNYSIVTDHLLKRKRILEFSGGTAEEWLKLAEEFKEDGGRCNHFYCMMQYRRLTAEVL